MAAGPLVHNVQMLRETLEGIPEPVLVRPYTFRYYRTGDEENWYRIWSVADAQHRGATPETFRKDFGTDEELVAQRMFFVCDGKGWAVGTATAWFRNYNRKEYGVVHWVAVLPEHQGKGIAKAVTARVLQRMKELGYVRALLVTQPFRLAAIKVYLGLGFTPEIRNDDDIREWRTVREKLSPGPLDAMDLDRLT